MSRSLKVAPQYIEIVKAALPRNRFASQRNLAESVQLSLSTVSNFLNGKPVDYLNFYELCHTLGLNLEEIADFSVADKNSSLAIEVDEEQTGTEPEISTYILRPPSESRCDETILKPGSLLRLKAPKRMGKTLLIDKILEKAVKENYRTVRLNLLQADQAVLRGLDEFLRWFCTFVSRRLKLPTQLAEYWEEGLGSSQNCTIYFEDHLLSQLDQPLVLALDDVDRIFPYPKIAQDFFGMLRVWHEEAKTSRPWQKLRLVISYSTDVYIQLNTNRSPFNVGVPIELPEFTSEQMHELAQKQGLNLDNSQVTQLIEMVGGHPHLIQLAIYSLTREDITFEQLLQTAATESGIYSNHLRGQLWNLQQYPELATAMKTVVEANCPVPLESILAFKLQSLGLVQLENNSVKPRCLLYSQYFSQKLRGKET